MEILQENHYYPFGLKMEGKWAPQIGKENKYQYNGKELDTDFGLNLYHYGFRLYDPAIGRFSSADPVSENFAFVSPYNYAESSPIANIDLWGLQAVNSTANSFYSGEGAKFQKSHPKQAKAIAAVPVVITGGILSAPLAKLSASGAVSTLAYETTASVVTGRGVSQIDLADVTLGGVFGFGPALVMGSLIDVKTNGEVKSLDGVVGEVKDPLDIGIDLTVGGVAGGAGKLAEGLGNAMKNQGNNLKGAAANLLAKDAAQTAPHVTLRGAKSRGTRHKAANLNYKGDLLNNAGSGVKYTGEQAKSAFTSLMQKYFGSEEK